MEIRNSNKDPYPVALVTGASRGLGRQIALTLASNGYGVVVNYISSKKEAEAVVSEIGDNALALQADIRSSADTKRMAEEIQRRFGRLDAIINNAGITVDKLLLKQTENEWDQIVDTNLKGCFNVMKIMTPFMIESGGGHIINISSYSGIKGKSGQAAYSASKSALLGLTCSTAREFSEHNIRVNAILPGFMPTEMGKKAERAMQTAREDSLLHKLSNPEDVAGFVLCLLGTHNITGQIFSLDSRIL